MLHISNVDDNKAEWNINETHIIIPMINGDKDSDKILTNALTLNSLESGDQRILANTLEHSFVIGLDKNLFETPSYKNDLVIIQNTDLKNSVAYTLSYVDHDKSEIYWQSSALKDRICASDKGVLEVRDILNYDDSEQDLEKTDQPICFNGLDLSVEQIAKTDIEIFTEENKLEEKSQFINYVSPLENHQSVLNVDLLNSVNSVKSIESKNLCDKFNFKTKNSTLRLEGNNKKNRYQETDVAHCYESKVNEFTKPKADKVCEIITNTNTKNQNSEKSDLPEKSLPLKKKAKMKKTLFSSENQKSLLKQDVGVSSQQVSMSSQVGKKNKQLFIRKYQNKPDSCDSDSDEPLINKVSKRKKTRKLKRAMWKYKQSISDSSVSGNEKSKRVVSHSSKEFESSKAGACCRFDNSKFNNIHDLVDCLRGCRMINASVWQILRSGLKEMKIDILQEMKAKKSEKCTRETISYSPQLKAFALILYFKQPTAFNYLAQVYNAGWPSLLILKEWKQQMNSSLRQIASAKSDVETC